MKKLLILMALTLGLKPVFGQYTPPGGARTSKSTNANTNVNAPATIAAPTPIPQPPDAQAAENSPADEEKPEKNPRRMSIRAFVGKDYDYNMVQNSPFLLYGIEYNINIIGDALALQCEMAAKEYYQSEDTLLNRKAIGFPTAAIGFALTCPVSWSPLFAGTGVNFDLRDGWRNNLPPDRNKIITGLDYGMTIQGNIAKVGNDKRYSIGVFLSWIHIKFFESGKIPNSSLPNRIVLGGVFSFNKVKK